MSIGNKSNPENKRPLTKEKPVVLGTGSDESISPTAKSNN